MSLNVLLSHAAYRNSEIKIHAYSVLHGTSPPPSRGCAIPSASSSMPAKRALNISITKQVREESTSLHTMPFPPVRILPGNNKRLDASPIPSPSVPQGPRLQVDFALSGLAQLQPSPSTEASHGQIK
ncbi:uncharacterized protein CLUP02_14635 [Colletotrichum lupini]|uniref:Uncharacterized protein n=1 Tax=Colletotrichum lupini TaxID=145971 RepID=A0A9Q8WN92_9PEZI|nr:uncharacterized protein CLUP02_14635 [Colletotrichum lupini]UQC89107.1 hypothetical protein CLUP02_14635 [Colletotrichum lupini]